MKIAVVFDSAGTLLRMYRVAKSIKTGEYLDEVVSTEFVGKKPYCAILVMQVDSNKLVICPPEMLISDFIKKYNIDIEVGCSRAQIDKTTALSVVENDTRAAMSDLQDVMAAVKKRCKDIFYMGVGLIIDIDRKNIPYVICTGGKVYSNTHFVINALNERNIDAYIASGDSMRNLGALANNVNVPLDRVFEIATPKKKEIIVNRLKQSYDKVVMVGDGSNDILAMRAADLGVLSIQQTGKCPKLLCEEADVVIRDIKEIIWVIEKEKSHLKKGRLS
ncbi:MAG: HAD family hydrolase [Candidatus Methanoperedens sp.]|nr:HAD family hydrolase [Candidatus Methanoperedens sp.]